MAVVQPKIDQKTGWNYATWTLEQGDTCEPLNVANSSDVLIFAKSTAGFGREVTLFGGLESTQNLALFDLNGNPISFVTPADGTLTGTFVKAISPYVLPKRQDAGAVTVTITMAFCNARR